MTKILLSAAVAAIALSATPAIAQERLTVWWEKGFYKAEDDALLAAIRRFEAKTGVKVELSQYAVQDMKAKSVAAVGRPCTTTWPSVRTMSAIWRRNHGS